MSFLIRNNELQEKYEIWIKVSNSIKKEFDNEPIYNWPIDKIIQNTKQNTERKTIWFFCLKQNCKRFFMIIECQMNVLNVFTYQ